MTENGERVRTLSEGRKWGGGILIQTESVYIESCWVKRSTTAKSKGYPNLSNPFKKLELQKQMTIILLFKVKNVFVFIDLTRLEITTKLF